MSEHFIDRARRFMQSHSWPADLEYSKDAAALEKCVRLAEAFRSYVDIRNKHPQVAGKSWRELCAILDPFEADELSGGKP